MSNYGNLQARIRREINRTDLTADISAAVQSAIRYYENQPFSFNNARHSFIALPSIQTVALPARFVEPEYLKLTWSTNFYPVERVQWSYIEDLLFNETYRSIPRYYAIYDDLIQFYPIPVSTMTGNLSYITRLSDLSDSADANAWTGEAEELIRLHAQVDLYETVIRGPEAHQQADRLRAREGMYLQRLKMEYAQQAGSGKVRGRGLLSSNY